MTHTQNGTFTPSMNEQDFTPDNTQVCSPDMSILEPARIESPSFPLEIFLTKIRDWIEIEAAIKCAPVDYVAACLLVSVAGLVGTTRQVQAWQGFEQYAILWLIIIGSPSSNKSPSMGSIKALLKRIERKWDKQHKTALAQLEKQIIEAEKAKKEWEIAVGNGEAVSDTPPFIPQKPARKRTILDSFTQEALEPIQAGNPKGVICYKDELSGFLANMGRYSGAKDAEKAYFLSCYDGSSATSDKVKYGDNPLTIARTALSLIGGLQPDKLDALTSGADDGFAARFMMLAPKPRAFTGRPNPAAVPDHDFIYSVFLHLAGFEHEEGSTADNPQAITLPLDDEAVNLFDDWLQGHKAKADIMSGKLASFWGKMSGQALRLALVLECLEGACNSVTSNAAEPTRVSYTSMKAALNLVEYYFKPTTGNVLGGLTDNPEIRGARNIALKIIELRPEKINSTEIRRKWKIEGLKTAAPINEAIQVLIDLNWLDWSEIPKGGSTGKRKSEWTVNPLVYSTLSDAPNATKGANKGFSGQPEANQEQPNAKEETHLNAFDLHLKEGEALNSRAFGANGAFAHKCVDQEEEPDENGMIWGEV